MFRKLLVGCATFCLCLLLCVGFARAQTDTPTPTPDNSSTVSDLENKITQLTNTINDLQGQEKTLSSQIAVMDSQVKLTEYRIDDAKQQILALIEDIDTTQKKITTLSSSLGDMTKLLLSRIVATYEVGSQNQFQMLLTSNNISDFFTRSNYLKVVQQHDRQLVYSTVQARNDYANEQQIYEAKKAKVISLQKQLEDYTVQLGQQKSAKQDLLTQTQGSEANYQNLLAQAKAQLAGFQGFASDQGGASLLSGQTTCDSWGCYYNQRDSQWGGLALNHSSYSIAEVGCLMTSVAMVYTHYGHRDVTPVSINSNPSNFAAYEPAYLLYTISANGVSSTRVGTYIDSNLQNGTPVIVGIRYASGDTHFVVLTGGSNGNYLMNDPFVPNGHQISFSSHYSMSSIFEIDKVIL